ncbi:hypothetical protein ALC53_06555 [Atta colombica]|uniref:Mos1 transposase HTH domain-containing protein n=1 Tax=Atta colombica TaxID=520822 RepID=A0A195BEI8_9HYME|nr:hypothetical protein ALC53_06555 [Atta colombica]
MSSFEPNKRHLRELLIYFFNLKKSAAEAHRLLVACGGKFVCTSTPRTKIIPTIESLDNVFGTTEDSLATKVQNQLQMSETFREALRVGLSPLGQKYVEAVLRRTQDKESDIDHSVYKDGLIKYKRFDVDDANNTIIDGPDAMWKAFIEMCTDIERLMQLIVPSSSSIQDLNEEFVKIYDTNNIKLTLNGICLYNQQLFLI